MLLGFILFSNWDLSPQELAAVGGKNAGVKTGRKALKKEKQNPLNISISHVRDKKGKPGSTKVSFKLGRDRTERPQKVEPLVKEEGEMSDNEEVYEQFKEVKWMEWCEDVMIDKIKTLRRLQRLQTTSANLPKDKVYYSIPNPSFYVSLIFFFFVSRSCAHSMFNFHLGTFENSELFAASWKEDRSNCLRT